LISGIVLGFTAIFLTSLLRVVNPAQAFKDDFETRLNLFILLLICLAAMLHITAPGATHEQVPPKNMLLLFVAILCGVIIGFLCNAH
jgi:drug/metabolite transporter (DMT)-like permease